MNGCIIADTPIAVDFWQIRQRPHLKIFFLSHMHGDHTKGLSASWRRPIYCSPITARLLPAKLHVPASLVKPLEVGQSHIIPLDETGQETMTVSLIDANHCPGAVIFLFEGYFGRILYTGDFRYQPSMITDTILSHCGTVDKLYLDNTYNNPKCIWPSRSECATKIIDIISQYPAYEIVIGVHKLGKEELIVDIALAFQTRIVVNPDRLQTLKILEMPDVFTTDSSCSRIRCVPQHLVTRKNVGNWQEGAPTIAILPTALYTSLEYQPFADHPDIFVVPYSDHSSHSELLEFVSRIKPKSIIPIVGASKFGVGSENMAVFDHFLDKTAKPSDDNITVPTSVLSFMNSASTTCHHIGHVVAQQRKLPKASINGRSKSAKDLPKGVVFDDAVDEDVTQELERRKQCEIERNLKQLIASDDHDNDEGKATDSLLTVKDNSSDGPASGNQESLTNTKSSTSTKATFNESSQNTLDATGQQPCKNGALNLNAELKPSKKKTVNVLTMLRSYASKRNASFQENAQTDSVITTERIESSTCNGKHSMDNGGKNLDRPSSSAADMRITCTTGDDYQKNRSVNLSSKPLLTESTLVDNENALQTSVRYKQECSNSNQLNSTLQECGKVKMTSKCVSKNNNSNYKAATSVAKRSASSSRLLVLPYGVRPINRKRGREERPPSLTEIFKQFCKK